jgi:hypothetical protein
MCFHSKSLVRTGRIQEPRPGDVTLHCRRRGDVMFCCVVREQRKEQNGVQITNVAETHVADCAIQHSVSANLAK